MNERTLIKVDMLKAEMMTDKEKEEYNIETSAKGFVVAELWLEKNKSKEEVEELLKIYESKGLDEAVDYYHNQHKETCEKVINHIQNISQTRNRTIKQIEFINGINNKYKLIKEEKVERELKRSK